MESVSEELVHTYLRLWSIIENLRIYDHLTRNEMLVCYTLYYNRTSRGQDTMTPTEIARTSRIRKSQVNRDLNKLEARGIVAREHSEADRRKVNVRLLDESAAEFFSQYHNIIELADAVVDRMGAERCKLGTELINQASDIAEQVFPLEDD